MKARRRAVKKSIDRPDKIFVFEIDGVPIVAFPAQSRKEAAGLQYQDWFKQELKRRQLWNGAPRRLVARLADAEQIEWFNKKANLSGEDLPLIFFDEGRKSNA
jgi:hypothetical protein